MSLTQEASAVLFSTFAFPLFFLKRDDGTARMLPTLAYRTAIFVVIAQGYSSWHVGGLNTRWCHVPVDCSLSLQFPPFLSAIALQSTI